MKKRINVILLVFVIFSFLIFLNPDFLPFKLFKGAIQTVFSAPKQALYSIKLGFLSQNKEIEKLKEENRKLSEKVSDFDRIKRDNEALRSQFESGSSPIEKMLTAKVVGFLGPLTHPTVLIINKGEVDGVKKGAAVVFGKNLVGKADKVSEKYSQIILPTNKNFTILGKSSENNSSGVVRGENDFILFDQVVITENLKSDELVLTKGESDDPALMFQREFIVGKISSINKKESQPFQTAKIESILSYHKLETVFVLLP